MTPGPILFVCSQARIRSRTAEVLAVRAGFDARCCGTDPDALVPINDHLIRMSELIVCMEDHHAGAVREFMHAEGKTIVVLGIEDIYEPFSDRLLAVLVERIEAEVPGFGRALVKTSPAE